MKARLIDLLFETPCPSKICPSVKDNKCNLGACRVHNIADHLLNNGVIVPPCKVGDKVWLVFTPKHPANKEDKGKWFMVQDGVQRIIYGAKGISIETWNMGTIPEKEIDKKLFFIEEEAKAVLEEKEQ